jgi:plastocyanin
MKLIIIYGLAGILAIRDSTHAPPEIPGPSSLATSAATQVVNVSIDNFKFTPTELTVPVGTTVKWTNRDDVPHTVTSKDDPSAFDSKALDTDQSFSFTFAKPGTYSYHCKIHTHMTATIIVK